MACIFRLEKYWQEGCCRSRSSLCGMRESYLARPLKELKGFEKVFLKHGESRRIQVKLDSDSFSYYDMDRHQFVTVPGSYLVQVGGSSVSLPLKEQILIP